MPYRRIPFVTGEIYHIFNRSVARQPIFKGKGDYERIFNLVNYYRFEKAKPRYSFYNRLPLPERKKFLEDLYLSKDKLVNIIAFCFMPNHVHLLVKQRITNGISKFMRNIQNSYAKYFNTKNKRGGALFQSMFKGVLTESDEQIVHIARYIHLNPLTSYLLEDINKLEEYPWSSFKDCLGKRSQSFVDKDVILGYFTSLPKFKKFTLDQVEYQRELAKIKHLVFE